LVSRRITDVKLEHEPVDLSFGERIRSLLLDRILRREDEKRLFELVSRSANRHLLFLHRLEQRGLNLRGCAIDFVRKNDVREDRTFLDAELAIRRIVDL